MAASTAAAPSSALLTADALPVIDLRVFTQSELRALSKSSASSVYELSYLFGGEEDVPVPKIDRAVFNESAGSRKQTYSRLRLAPRKPEITTSRVGEVRSRMDEVDNWENRRIVGMLKELVGEGSGEAEVFDGLVAVEIECDPELNLPDVEMVRHPVKVEVGAVSPVRRKRGRPRKDSDVTANKIVLYNSQDVNEFGGEKLCESKKKNNEEDDMEMVNKNGVVVDLVALGNADDPFGPEMRRQTEGMSTKEQLLEFLNGLDGKWVSRRRKRKIVDASYFGDVLPNGWKLLFSIKKKSGHAWLICRRYISPSGREFISCKEVASYLQHLSGMQSEGPKNTICNDENIMPVEKFPTENVGNQFVQDDIILDQHPSRSLIPNPATQVEPESHISLPVTTKNDGSPHILPSSPKSKLKRRKLGTLVSDGVIITDGKFECQFCHKIFEERRRYNGHVGVHVRNVEALRGTGTKSAGADLCSVSGVLPVASSLDITAISSSGAQENHNDGTMTDVMELGFLHTKLVDGSEVGDCTGKSNIEMSHSQVNVEVKQNIIDEAVLEQSNDKSDRNYKMAEDAVGKLDKSSSIGAEMSHSVAPQTKLVENDLLELCEVSRISMSEVKTVGEDGNSEKSTVVYNAAGKQSEGDEKSNGDSASFGEKLIADVESIQHAVDETFNGENNIGSLVTNGNEEHTIDFTEQFGNERSPFNLGMVDNGQEDVCAFYQQRSAGNSSHASFLNEQRHSSINCENAAVASRLVEYKENFPEKDPPNSVRNKQGLTASNNFLDGISGHSSTPDFMHPSILGIQPAVVSSSNHATLGGNDWSRDTPQKIFGVTHLFPSLSQNMGANNVKTTPTDVNSKSPWKQPTFNPQIAVDSVDRASNGMISKEFWKAVDVPSNSVAKTGSETMLDMAVVSRCGQDKVSGDYSFSSLGNEQGFNIRSDMVGMVDNSMQESRLERDYVSDFINPFDNGQSNRAPSKLFPTRPMEQPRPDEARFSLNSELQISLGNDQSRLDAINRNLKGQSLVLSGNEHFGLHNNSNAFYNSSVEEPRDQRARGSGLMGQFGQQELFGLQNNLNQAYNDSVWGGEQRIGPIGNFGPNDPMTFGSSQQTQRSENVLTGGLWSVGANAHGFVDLSLSRGQPSSYLPNLQMMSSKGDDQYFGGVQKINNPGGFQDQRGGIQQREYNFLNANAKPYTQDTNVLPYEQQIQQSYDHASWLGRQAPFPQVLARNPQTASCVWCSNAFYLESLNSFSQADTIVPTCPSCKTKMTEQLNLS
ncbi:unnamed protein product [Rhodiola kirilowii]